MLPRFLWEAGVPFPDLLPDVQREVAQRSQAPLPPDVSFSCVFVAEPSTLRGLLEAHLEAMAEEGDGTSSLLTCQR